MNKKRKIPELILRIVSGTILMIIVALLICWNNSIFAGVLLGLLSLIAVWEYFRCVDLKNSPHMFFGLILSLAMTVIIILFKEKMYPYLSLIFIFTFISTVIIGLLWTKKYTFKDIPVTLFGYFYSIFLILFSNKIFLLENGNIKMALILAVVVATDTFAFFIGSKFGKHKFSKISPNKSVEGSLAGIIFAIISILLYTFLVNKYLDYNLNYILMAVVGAFLSIVSQIGDLTASYIKRTYNKKDFGSILPGQGGILDRIDSLIFSAPFAYVIILLLM